MTPWVKSIGFEAWCDQGDRPGTAIVGLAVSAGSARARDRESLLTHRPFAYFRSKLPLALVMSHTCGTSTRRTPSNSQPFKSNTPHAPPELARVGLTVRAVCTPFGRV
jgi:hypothetical protein